VERRAFLTAFMALLAAPLAAQAQPAKPVPRDAVGVCASGPQRLVGISRFQGVVPLRFQNVPGQVADVGLVIDNQDRFHGPSVSGQRGPVIAGRHKDRSPPGRRT